MAELAFYPGVALMYFFGVMRASKEKRVDLPDSASVNVFCLFVLVQPLCLVIGGYTGMIAYLITALISYNSLHWKDPAAPQQAHPEQAHPEQAHPEQTEKKKKKKKKTN